MIFRGSLPLVYTALCILSLYNANAFNLAGLQKQPRIGAFSWKNCGPDGDPVQVKSLSVAPDPVVIPGNITVSTSFTISKAGGADLELQLELEIKVAGFWVKVPCVDNVGSCTYSGLCAQWPDTCTKYFEKYGIPCTCPIAPNTYTVSDFVASVDQKLPVSLKGDIRATANLVSTAAGHQACIYLELNIQS